MVRDQEKIYNQRYRSGRGPLQFGIHINLFVIKGEITCYKMTQNFLNYPCPKNSTAYGFGKKHCEENVKPIQAEYSALQNEKEDRWSWHPRQIELMEGAKEKAKELGLWNFFYLIQMEISATD